MDGNIQKYQAFIRTVEYGSFTKAAETLGYTQSSVSKMIADLEQEWQVNLLERSRAGVQLTADGMAMLPYAENIVADYRKLQDEVANLNGLRQGVIRIGTFSSVATHWIPGIIQSFQKDYPGIQYELLLGDYDEIENWLAMGRIECGFLRLPTRKEFETIFLEKDELVAVLPPNHPLIRKEKLRPKDLNAQPFLLLEHGGKAEVSEFLEQNRIQPDIRFTTWDDYSILSMVESGLGIGILPRLILHRIPYAVEVRPFTKPAYREIALAIRNQKTASAAVKKFVQYLKYRN